MTTRAMTRSSAAALASAESISIETHDPTDFIESRSDDLLEKCRRFQQWLGDMRARGLFQRQYRVTIEGALDHRIQVRTETGRRRELICFDSNSYLGLHLHPRVVDATRRALDAVGYGTPSAQLLGGTNRYLRELEDTISGFFGREDTMITPTGYAANVGALTALLGRGDRAVCDRFSHASIHDGCRFSNARSVQRYRHLDVGHLDRILGSMSSGGRLVATDGVFSMHGRIAPLPELRRVADRHGATLYLDDAHGLGVLGATGRGVEEHWQMQGAADVLMGTFSKAPGAVGGYVSGSRELVEYLRIYARSCMFTAALPAALCAGLTEAIRVIDEEPEHRERLWRNCRRLWLGLRQSGLCVPELESAIVPVFLGHEALLWQVSSELFDAGFKCGNVTYPAVPRGEGIIRMSVSARHTRADIDALVEAMARLGSRHGLLGLTRQEVTDLGAQLGGTAASGSRVA